MRTSLIFEVGFAGAVGALGAAMLRVALPGVRRTLTILLSGLMGTLVITISSVASLSVGRPNGLVVVGFITVLVTVSMVVVEARRGQLSKGSGMVASAAAVNAGVTFVIGLLVAPVLTYDSWRFIEYGASVFGDGASLQDLSEKILGNYPIALTSIEGLAFTLGDPLLSAGIACFGVLGVVAAFDLLASRWRSLPRWLHVSVMLIGVIAVTMTTYQTRLQLGYINSHALAAGWYTLGAALIFAPAENLLTEGVTEGTERAFLIGLACCGMSLTRVEGLLVCVLLTAAAVSHRRWSRREIRVMAGVGLVIPVIWYSRLSYTLVEADILSPPRLVGMVLLAVGPLVVAYVLPLRLHEWMAATALIGLAGSITFLALTNPEGLGTSATSLALSLASKGLWGPIWWVVAPMTVIAFVRLREREQIAPWLVLTGGYLLLVLALGGLREFPYFARWGDSGNRMMIHVLPVVALLLFYSLGGGPDREVNRLQATRRTTTGDPTPAR